MALESRVQHDFQPIGGGRQPANQRWLGLELLSLVAAPYLGSALWEGGYASSQVFDSCCGIVHCVDS